MASSRLQARYWRIVFFFAGVVAGFIFWDFILPRIGLGALARRTRTGRFRSAAVQFRRLALRLGGVMIKVGQFLSSRLDILPPAITDELSSLQDEVPPEDFAAVRRLAEAELGAPLEAKYAFFDETPLAAASLGQVHRAKLREDSPEAVSFRDVVVKVQRPMIEQLIEVDLAALRRVGGWLERYRPIREHADVPALIREFSDTVRDETDYLAEGHNAETFQENFKEHARVHVPRVAWSLTTRRVLTLEDVYAIKITDYEAITAAGVERSEVALELFDVYLKQIFEDGFFHADPHPGNLFVTPGDGEASPDWRLTFVDFGMAGRIPANLREGLRELAIAMGTRDASRVIRGYQMLGILLPGADLKRVEEMETQLFDRFWGMSMSELRGLDMQGMRRFGRQFQDLMLSMPFQAPNDLLMLFRTLAILSGMCTGLDPDFNLWQRIAPYAGKLVADEAGAKWETWLDELGDLARVLIALPAQTGRVLARAEQGELTMQMPEVSRRIENIERAINRLVGGVIFAALTVGGTMLYNAGNTLLGGMLLAASVPALILTLFFPRGDSNG